MLQWDICEIHSRTLWLRRYNQPPPALLKRLRVTVARGRTGIVLLCHPLLGWSAAGAAVRWVQGHTVVLFWEKGLLCCQVAVVGRDSYGFVFPPRVTASAAPFAPLTDSPPHPNLMALTPALTPASPRAGSAYEHVCVHPSSGCVRRLRPIRLASTDVTGLEECEECGGAGAGVSILGPGQRGTG